MQARYNSFRGNAATGKSDPPSKGSFLDSMKGALSGLVDKYGPQAIEMIEDLMGQSEMDEALEEFNEKADNMPTARESNMRPNRRDLMSLVGKLGDPQEMRPRQAKYVPGGSDYKPFVKMMSYEEDRELNDTSGGRGLIDRTNPNVGEGVRSRRRFRVRRR